MTPRVGVKKIRLFNRVRTRAELHLTHGHFELLALERLILTLELKTELNWKVEFEAST